jgi:hypothetical protein
MSFSFAVQAVGISLLCLLGIPATIFYFTQYSKRVGSVFSLLIDFPSERDEQNIRDAAPVQHDIQSGESETQSHTYQGTGTRTDTVIPPY